MDFSKNEIILLVVIGVVVIFFALRNKGNSTTNAAQIYGLTAKQALAPSDVLAFQNASEESATRQDAFNLAKLNIASNLVGKSFDFQNQQKLLDKVQAFDLAQLQANQAQQTKQGILNSIGQALSKLLGGGSSSGGSQPRTYPNPTGGYTPPYVDSINLPDASIYNAGLVSSLPDVWDWFTPSPTFGNWFDNPPVLSDGSGVATGITYDDGSYTPFDNNFGGYGIYDLGLYDTGGGNYDWNTWYNDNFGA